MSLSVRQVLGLAAAGLCGYGRSFRGNRLRSNNEATHVEAHHTCDRSCGRFRPGAHGRVAACLRGRQWRRGRGRHRRRPGGRRDHRLAGRRAPTTTTARPITRHRRGGFTKKKIAASFTATTSTSTATNTSGAFASATDATQRGRRRQPRPRVSNSILHLQAETPGDEPGFFHCREASARIVSRARFRCSTWRPPETAE